MKKILLLTGLISVLFLGCSTDSGSSSDSSTLDCSLQEGETKVFILTGTVDGEAVDIRQTNGDANGSFLNLSSGSFESPNFLNSEDSTTLAQVKLNWEKENSELVTESITGSVYLPTSHAKTGTWYIKAPAITLYGPSEEETKGTIQFKFTELYATEDLSGTAITADLSGCWN
jgi:hypothetical protein